MAYYECLRTRLNPLAEVTCLSQVINCLFDGNVAFASGGAISFGAAGGLLMELNLFAQPWAVETLSFSCPLLVL